MRNTLHPVDIIGDPGFAFFLTAIAIWVRRNAAPAKSLFSGLRGMRSARRESLQLMAAEAGAAAIGGVKGDRV
jgi:hypothetical protein